MCVLSMKQYPQCLSPVDNNGSDLPYQSLALTTESLTPNSSYINNQYFVDTTDSTWQQPALAVGNLSLVKLKWALFLFLFLSIIIV